MDNAPYHHMLLEDGVPPLSSKKVMLQQWLHENNIPFNEHFIRKASANPYPFQKKRHFPEKTAIT
jgi:hypothetical protein